LIFLQAKNFDFIENRVASGTRLHLGLLPKCDKRCSRFPEGAIALRFDFKDFRIELFRHLGFQPCILGLREISIGVGPFPDIRTLECDEHFVKAGENGIDNRPRHGGTLEIAGAGHVTLNRGDIAVEVFESFLPAEIELLLANRFKVLRNISHVSTT